MSRFPRLLICEGFEDKWFFEALIEARDLPRFHVRAANGKDKFEQALLAFQVLPQSNWPSIGELLVVGDNDDRPADRFDAVRRQLNSFFEKDVAPRAPLERSTKSKPACTIMMLPWAETAGALESVVQDAARQTDEGVAGSIDNFMAAVRAERWDSDLRRDKAWIRSFLAASSADPGMPFGELFSEPKYRHLIDFNHRSFDRIADVLKSLDR